MLSYFLEIKTDLIIKFGCMASSHAPVASDECLI